MPSQTVTKNVDGKEVVGSSQVIDSGHVDSAWQVAEDCDIGDEEINEEEINEEEISEEEINDEEVSETDNIIQWIFFIKTI